MCPFGIGIFGEVANVHLIYFDTAAGIYVYIERGANIATILVCTMP